MKITYKPNIAFLSARKFFRQGKEINLKIKLVQHSVPREIVTKAQKKQLHKINK